VSSEPIDGMNAATGVELPEAPPTAPIRKGRRTLVPSPDAKPFEVYKEPKRSARRERHDVRARARKVRRVIRRFDPWSVLKLSLLFYFCLFVVMMVAGTLLWSLASGTGTITDIEGFIKDVGAFKTFEFEGTKIFRASLLAGLILVIVGSAFNVLLAVLFNLISDLVGGIRVTVLEEEHTGQS